MFVIFQSITALYYYKHCWSTGGGQMETTRQKAPMEMLALATTVATNFSKWLLTHPSFLGMTSAGY